MRRHVASAHYNQNQSTLLQVPCNLLWFPLATGNAAARIEQRDSSKVVCEDGAQQTASTDDDAAQSDEQQ